MLVVLQAGPGSTGLVNAAVVVLVIVFLTLPTIFVLAEFLRRRRQNEPKETPAPAVPLAQTPSAPARPDGVLLRGLRTVESRSVEHDFTREPVTPEIGWIAPDERLDGSIVYSGHLQLARRVRVVGDIQVSGSLALGEGVYVVGDVSAGGNVYLLGGANVDGRVKSGGSVFMSAWSRAQHLGAEGDVEMEAGAHVSGVLEAGRLFTVDRASNPRLRGSLPQDDAPAPPAA